MARRVRETGERPNSEQNARTWRQVRAFCSEFGLSPVSRTRLAIERKDEATEDLEAILGRAREPRPLLQ